MSSKRPAHVQPPAYLSKSPPVPIPDPVNKGKDADDPLGLNPVRYGDWVLKGIAIDF
jgi:Protein of unknown function (DUF1674)